MVTLGAAGGMAQAPQEQKSARQESTDKTTDALNHQNPLPGSKKAARQDVSDSDSTSVLQFANEHHPELARLLEQLGKSRPGEFARAERELSQQIKALERVQERNPEKYQVQLETWKRDSQIRVLMARWFRSQDPELEKEVRELLTARREARLAQLRSEQKRLAEQLKKVEEQLAVVSQPIEPEIEKEWEQLSKKASIRKSSDKKSAEPAASAAAQGKTP
jgi:hypothetical protein